MNRLKVKVYRENRREAIKLPEYKSAGASGFDLVIIHNTKLRAGETQYVHTGLFFEIPEGFEMQIRSRSGIARDLGLIVLNQPGTIDSDYRGEIRVLLYNISRKTLLVEEGTRIAQGVICPVMQVQFEEVRDIFDLASTTRGSNGLGSTGKV